MRTWITDLPIVPEQLLGAVGSADDGAVLLFVGTVRRENHGREVIGMRYESYQGMAERVLSEIASEACARIGEARIAIAHRIGDLQVGEISVGIAISAPHRAEAYAGSRYIIEEIKKRLPVWKAERYASGETEWLGGQTPPVPEVAHE
jgi:molybdopterin synthase catalytic subunit